MADILKKSREGETVYFAKTNFRGQDRIFGIKKNDRRQHMYIIGQTGTGKSALLRNMALQDIKAGRGVCLVDPHGEFVESVLGYIPEERAKDVVYFNPVDIEFPIGFNILEVPDPEYKHLVASGLMGVFMKIWPDVWSPRMEYILSNCVLALLDTPGTSLLGIPRLLVDKDYRQKIVANIKDPVVRSFWVHEYEAWRDQFRNEAIVPIQNKVGRFLNTTMIRNVVGQEKSTLNIAEIMNSKKILLVNVSKGRIGEDNSALLGGMLITKIQLEAMERVRIPEEERQDFYLYVDEFQNFATDSFASILSEARKYRLDLVIAHQYIGQIITDISTKVRDAIFGNVGTRIVFRVGASDAEFLEQEFTPEFVIQDLVNLPNYHIYVRMMVNNFPSRPFSAVTLPPIVLDSLEAVKKKIISHSRELYARPRQEVEREINRWSRGEESEEGGEFKGRVRDKAVYQADCWVCGKTTRLTFKPDNNRPVYCTACLRKIQTGELAPLPTKERRGSLRGQQPRYESGLAELGIEFSGPVKKSPPSFLKSRVVKKPRPQETISLKELAEFPKKTARPKIREKESPNLQELRKALSQALGGALKTGSGNNNKNNKGSLKPGEKIKFE